VTGDSNDTQRRAQPTGRRLAVAGSSEQSRLRHRPALPHAAAAGQKHSLAIPRGAARPTGQPTSLGDRSLLQSRRLGPLAAPVLGCRDFSSRSAAGRSGTQSLGPPPANKGAAAARVKPTLAVRIAHGASRLAHAVLAGVGAGFLHTLVLATAQSLPLLARRSDVVHHIAELDDTREFLAPRLTSSPLPHAPGGATADSLRGRAASPSPGDCRLIGGERQQVGANHAPGRSSCG